MLPVGPYIPRAKLRFTQPELYDTTTPEYQLSAWKTLEKSINGRINKVNTSNLPLIIRELCEDNIIRGYGLLVRSIIQKQLASPFYTSVYAALVSFINVTLPIIGESIAKHLISSFRRTHQQNDKTNCLRTIKFIAHFVNQNILHDIVALEMLVFLLENPTDDSVELAIEFLKECGQKLSQVSPHGLDSVFSTLNNLLYQSLLDKRTQYMIEILFNLRKDQFKSNPAIQPCLHLVDENYQYTHMITLDNPCQPDPMLGVFLFDDQYDKNEEEYYEMRKTILDEECRVKRREKRQQRIMSDQIETNLVTLRRTIYLTMKSSIDVEECANKLLNMNLCPEHEMELCQIIFNTCIRKRTYKRFFALLGRHFCSLKKEYVQYFENIFQNQYEIIHHLKYIRLRKVAKFFAHLLVTDAISWNALHCICIAADSTASSRVYIMTLFLELTEYLGLNKLKNRLTDPALTEYLQGIFPRDNKKKDRFSIKFFTLIGLSELTEINYENISQRILPASPTP